jgi:hypothetical protein
MYNPQLSEPEAFDPKTATFFPVDATPNATSSFLAADEKTLPTPAATVPSTPSLSSTTCSLTVRQWHPHTHRWCAHHCAPFESSPVFIPRQITATGEWDVLPGVCFCGFECARAFVEDSAQFSTRQVTELITMLHIMKYQMTHDRSPIQRAPVRHLRDVFQSAGEGLPLDTWKTCRTQYQYFPPLQPMSVIIETLSTQLTPPSLVLPTSR